MFERFTEKARRTVFFARWEASNYGSATIETEHLLLGILYEDKALASSLSLAHGLIRDEISKRTPPPKEPTSTSVDLALSHEAKRALSYAANESQALNDSVIGPEHLILGLLRVENCFAALLLRQHGVEHDACLATFIGPNYRHLEQRQYRPSSMRDSARLRFQGQAGIPEPAAPSLRPVIAHLGQLLDNAARRLVGYSEQDAMQALKRKTWSRKEALGHLADWAMTHQGWLARALTEPKLNAPGYPGDDWASVQQYNALPWQEVADLWASVNRVLMHVLRHVPEEKLTTPCRIGIAGPIPLSTLIDRYVEHCEDVLEQILARL